MGDYMTDSTQDTISRVLKSNAGDFEKKEIQHAALVGMLIGAINFILDLMLLLRAEEVLWFQYFELTYGLMLVVLGGLVFRRSTKATVAMLAMLMAGVLGTLLHSTLGEQINVIGIIGAVIWGLIVWFKVYPAIDSIKVLAADDIKPLAPAGSPIELGVVGIAYMILLVRVWLDLTVLFL